MIFASPFPAGLWASRGEDVMRRFGWLVAAVVAALAALIRWCPSTQVRAHDVVGELTAILRVSGMVDQLRDPWVGLANGRRFSSYFFVATRWRILPPFIGHALHLTPKAYLSLPRAGAWCVLLLGAWYAHRMGGNRAAWVAALGLVGSAAWLSSVEMVQFDGWYLALLLVAAFSPRTVAAWAAAALGPWIDERFVLFLPAALLVRLAWSRRLPWRELSGVGFYALARMAALFLGEAGLSRQLGLTVLGWGAGGCAVGWGLGWRLGWVLLLAGAWKVFGSVRPWQRWLSIGAAAGIAAAAALAIDYTRTAPGLLPLAVLGAAHLSSRTRWMAVAVAVVLLNFALPYWHIYGKEFAPVRSVFSAPPGTWVMPFTMPPLS